MTTADRAEADRDDAAAELRALRFRRNAVRETIYAALCELNDDPKALRVAMESIDDTLADLLFDECEEIQSRLSEAQDALSHAESMDERRSAPVVI